MSRSPSLAPNTRRRRLVQAAALFVLVPAAYPVDAQIALSTAINRAARFRALSQRCAKAYTQLFLDVLPENAREVLATAQRLVQLGFEDLSKAGFPSAVAEQIALTRLEYGELAKMLQAAPTKANVAGISAQADRMLMAADKTTSSLQAQAKQSSAKLVNIAGRQRMLSQRMAKNYFLKAAGLENRTVGEQLAQDRSAFVEAMAALNAAPLSTANIRNELALGQQQWLFFEQALTHKPDSTGLKTVATTSERLLEVMNNLTALYDAALKELLGNA